jgi:hypothetical protein
MHQKHHTCIVYLVTNLLIPVRVEIANIHWTNELRMQTQRSYILPIVLEYRFFNLGMQKLILWCIQLILFSCHLVCTLISNVVLEYLGEIQTSISVFFSKNRKWHNLCWSQIQLMNVVFWLFVIIVFVFKMSTNYYVTIWSINVILFYFWIRRYVRWVSLSFHVWEILVPFA